MVTRKKYRLKKKIKNFLIFYAFICISFFASYTFSRYIDTTNGTYKIGIANFNVLVNGENVTLEKPFLLALSANKNTLNNKIAPDKNGYFEIEIDPTGTEVSLEYEFLFNLDNLDEDIKIVSYEMDDKTYPVENNLITGDLLLPNGLAFSNEDKLVIKVNWEWNEDITNPNPEDLDNNILVTSVVKQKIG